MPEVVVRAVSVPVDRARGGVARMLGAASHVIHETRRRVRGYPSPADFNRMGPVKTEAYLRKIGFDRQVRDALARHDARQSGTTD